MFHIIFLLSILRMESIKLNNGVMMPLLGFGVFQISPHDTERCCLEAIQEGYRLIDTAQAYRNEESVGKALKKCGVPREQMFITTKIWNSNQGYERAKASIDQSLHKLQTDYIDLLLIHQPVGDYLGTWKAMEEYYHAGKLKAIGVSNFKPSIFADFAKKVDIKPMVNQVETHVFWQQRELREVMKPYGTKTMSWGPLAEGRNNFFSNETLVNIGKSHNKTAAQIGLKFLVQSDIITIPKTVRRERMKENINIFDFKLSDHEMDEIYKLDRNETLFFWI